MLFIRVVISGLLNFKFYALPEDILSKTKTSVGKKSMLMIFF